MRFIFTDHTGRRYGRLTVIDLQSRNGSDGPTWLCKCDCGNDKIVSAHALVAGRTVSCGCYKRQRQSEANTRFKPMPGQRFGRLTLIEEVARRDKWGKRQFRCQCDCGTETIIYGFLLIDSKRATASCGCLQVEASITHGDTIEEKTSEYITWVGMLQRCNNPNSTSYKRYGKRGIKVCERWHKYENFLTDMGRKPTLEHTIDRYPNNDGDYEPNNCRWATIQEQQWSKRS